MTPFECIKGTLINAPHQNIFCNTDNKKLADDSIEVLNFNIVYEFCGKIYTENYPVSYTAFRKNLTIKTSTNGKGLQTIFYTSQEMIQKDL